MRLTEDERAILAGERGEAVRRALELQITVGDFFGADDIVAIDSAHMMVEIGSMGEPCVSSGPFWYLSGSVAAASPAAPRPGDRGARTSGCGALS
jgi:hypothetical protein